MFLQTSIRDLGRLIWMSHDVFMSSVTHFDLTEDDSSDYPPQEGNYALRDGFRAVHEKVTTLRRTNNGTASHNAN